jgi:hypothetical protein
MCAMEQKISLMTHEADVITNDLTPEGSQVQFPNSNWRKQSSPVIRNQEKLTSMTFQGLIRGEHQLEHEEIILQEALLQDINTKNQLDKAQINLNTMNMNGPSRTLYQDSLQTHLTTQSRSTSWTMVSGINHWKNQTLLPYT